MRRKLTLTVLENHKLYGVDEENKVVLHPEDFRGTVLKSILLGTFKEGDQFEVEINAEGSPIRRSFDHTVAIHVPIEKRYSRQEIEVIIKKVLKLVEEGKEVDIKTLLN
jgi:hypothetical protein